MNFSDAMKEVVHNRKKMRRRYWENKDFYVAINSKRITTPPYVSCYSKGELVTKDRTFYLEDYIADDWEIYEEKCDCGPFLLHLPLFKERLHFPKEPYFLECTKCGKKTPFKEINFSFFSPEEMPNG
jgi:hypothetical protein